MRRVEFGLLLMSINWVEIDVKGRKRNVLDVGLIGFPGHGSKLWIQFNGSELELVV